MLGAKVTLSLAALALIYVYLLYPALLCLLALFRRTRSPEPGYTPFLSILIAACNEGAVIEKKLRCTLSLDYPADRIEILVVSDGSEDETDDIVRAFPDERIRLVRIPARRGKTNAQNAGVRSAKGDVLVFSDATTIYQSRALRYLAAHYKDPSVGAVSGRYEYFDSTAGSPTGMGSITFWSYENRIKVWQSAIATLTGCCGCIYSVRRSIYTELAPDIISDLVQPLHVIRKGYRVAFEERALAFEQTTESTREELSMRVRIVTRAMRGLLSVPDLLRPWRHPWIAFQLISHKVLRWMIPLFLTAALFSNALLAREPYLRALLIGQLCFYGLALLGLAAPVHRLWKPLGMPLYFCTLNTAAILGLVALLRGRKYVTWQPVRYRG